MTETTVSNLNKLYYNKFIHNYNENNAENIFKDKKLQNISFFLQFYFSFLIFSFCHLK